MRLSGGLLGATLALAGACGVTPRPRILEEVAAVRTGAAGREAAALAPQTYLRAEALYRQAKAAADAGSLPRSQILSEHALAAYHHAFVLARQARAEEHLLAAQQRLARTEAQLMELDEQQRRTATEADDLELRLKVLRDAEPLAPTSPASPERERARRQAARSLALQGRLLCASARLLDPQAKDLGAADTKLAELEQQLAAPANRPIPMDAAFRARSECLRLLTVARRPATRSAPAAGAADALLAELSAIGTLFVFRDDRGVVVTLRGLFAPNDVVSSDEQPRLAALGQVAKSHPDFPVLVVAHSSRGGRPGDERRAYAVRDALKAAGAPSVECHFAGNAQPLLDPGAPQAAEQNTRIELVFVAPAY